MKQPSMGVAGKVALGAGLSALAATGAVFAVSRYLFDFAVDTQSPRSMIARLRTGKVEGANLEGVHYDAQEEAQAADWFVESRQPVAIRSQDGFALRGWLLDPDCASPAPHRYAVCCHGYSGSPDHVAKYARRFARMGFTVLAPASRGHEPSEGRYIGMGWLERRDLMRWIDLIVESDPQARILLYGLSMGASTVMMTVGERALPRNVVAAIEDCGYTCVRDEFMAQAGNMYHMPRWMAALVVDAAGLISKRRAGYGFREASCVVSLRHATIPMMFIHGGEDTFVPSSFLERNYEACASLDREKLLVPGAAHGMSASTDPERYWRRVGAFVRRAFGD
ncbi:alpha/beta hydrolase [Bifidobacterium lemurum]|uniref:Alpha/beta hydrolase n=1 Tax=Bifidobacterium lemurum TaxID=1603886 RepID=A0A261FMJ6_9BIFI|nr:alpha/beta hydrolase [Bifidobacterium lemurum]OZG60183.1 alpha/beta hydrolase [Bifidobacterium lemurum]QOL34085.1 alpha/beta hydrolase [Bifidobacterium lemurum]